MPVGNDEDEDDERFFEIEPGADERWYRRWFRYRARVLFEAVDSPDILLPNKQRVRELLTEALSLVPPESQLEEEWEDHHLRINRGEIQEGSDQDRKWQEDYLRRAYPTEDEKKRS